MKPTKRQTELIKAISGIISSWDGTNDINSPTHYDDIGEELRKLDLEVDDYLLIGISLSDLLMMIQKNDRENKET